MILTSTKILTTLTLDLTSKVVRSWKDALEKANAQYQEAKLASACSLENILGRWGSLHIVITIIIVDGVISNLIIRIIVVTIIIKRWDGDDLEESGYPGGFLHAPISRRNSRRSSRYSRWWASIKFFPFDQRSLLLMIFTPSIGHSHSGSVDLQDQERSVASGKREVCPPGLHSSTHVQHLR